VEDLARLYHALEKSLVERNKRILFSMLSLCGKSLSRCLTLSQQHVCQQLLRDTKRLEALPPDFPTDLIVNQECARSYSYRDCKYEAKFAHPDKSACSRRQELLLAVTEPRTERRLLVCEYC